MGKWRFMTTKMQIPIWFERLLHKDYSSLCFLTNILKLCKQWSSISPVCSVSSANTVVSPRSHISFSKSQRLSVCTRANQWPTTWSREKLGGVTGSQQKGGCTLWVTHWPATGCRLHKGTTVESWWLCIFYCNDYRKWQTHPNIYISKK